MAQRLSACGLYVAVNEEARATWWLLLKEFFKTTNSSLEQSEVKIVHQSISRNQANVIDLPVVLNLEAVIMF